MVSGSGAVDGGAEVVAAGTEVEVAIGALVVAPGSVVAGDVVAGDVVAGGVVVVSATTVVTGEVVAEGAESPHAARVDDTATTSIVATTHRGE
jgi:cytoskeletal protein CcmA (bactofilin family)